MADNKMGADLKVRAAETARWRGAAVPPGITVSLWMALSQKLPSAPYVYRALRQETGEGGGLLGPQKSRSRKAPQRRPA